MVPGGPPKVPALASRSFGISANDLPPENQSRSYARMQGSWTHSGKGVARGWPFFKRMWGMQERRQVIKRARAIGAPLALLSLWVHGRAYGAGNVSVFYADKPREQVVKGSRTLAGGKGGNGIHWIRIFGPCTVCRLSRWSHALFEITALVQKLRLELDG